MIYIFIIMKQIITLILLTLNLNIYSQNNSLEWFNLKSEVKSIRQSKFEIKNEMSAMRGSDFRRFEDIIFLSIAQQLLIDNSYIEFSNDGKIEKWFDFNENNEICNELKFYYSDHFVLDKIEILSGKKIKFTVNYQFDPNGLNNFIEMKGVKSIISRDSASKIILEKISKDLEVINVSYTYRDDGIVQLHMYDGKSLEYTLENKFNDNLDFIFDGRYNYEYEYDVHGNWISKSGFLDNECVIKYNREIQYY
jgi:hypothetical protein